MSAGVLKRKLRKLEVFVVLLLSSLGVSKVVKEELDVGEVGGQDRWERRDEKRLRGALEENGGDFEENGGDFEENRVYLEESGWILRGEGGLLRGEWGLSDIEEKIAFRCKHICTESIV